MLRLVGGEGIYFSTLLSETYLKNATFNIIAVGFNYYTIFEICNEVSIYWIIDKSKLQIDAFEVAFMFFYTNVA